MKKRIAVAVALILSVFTLFAFAACDVAFRNKELESIEIDTAEAKLEYLEGDEFSSEGLWLIARYSDGSSTVLERGFYISVPNMNLTDEERASGADYVTRDVTVTYGLVTESYQIRIRNTAFDHSALDRIEVKAKDAEKRYFVGDTFGKGDVVVTAYFDTGLSKEVDVEFADVALDAAGSKTVTFSYTHNGETRTAEFTFTVEAVVLESIEITNEATVKEFFVGDAFTYEGLEITARYNDSRKDGVVMPDSVVGSTAEAGDAIVVTISYQGQTTSYTIKVKAVVLEGIEITSGPEDKEYDVGEEFLAEGLKVTAHYNNGDVELGADKYELQAPSTDVAGTQSGKVTFGGMEATFTITVYDVLTSLEVTDSVNEYFEGDLFNEKTLTVKAIYNGDPETAEQVEFTVVSAPEEALVAGQTYTVTVSYTASGDYVREKTLTAEYSIENVREIEVVSFTVDWSALEDRTFTYGEEYDFSGIAVTVKYNHGEDQTYTYEGPDSANGISVTYTENVDEKSLTVKVSYGEGGEAQSKDFTLTVSAEAPTVNSIAVTSERPVLTAGGDVREILTVTASLSDSTQQTVEEYTIDGEDTLFTEPGEVSVTVKYMEQEASITVYVVPANPIANYSVNATEGNGKLETWLYTISRGEEIKDAKEEGTIGRDGRTTVSWLLAEVDGSYEMAKLVCTMSGWSTDINCWNVADENGSKANGNRIEGSEITFTRDNNYLDFGYAGANFRIVGGATWQWLFLGWSFSSISVRVENAAVTQNAPLDLKVTATGNYTNSGGSTAITAEELVLDLDTSDSSEIGVYSGTVTYPLAEKYIEGYEPTAFNYCIIPQVIGTWETSRMYFGESHLSLLITEREGMATESENGTAAGWLWNDDPANYDLVPFDYTYTAEGGVHAFTFHGSADISANVTEEGSLKLSYGGSEYTAAENWKEIVCGWKSEPQYPTYDGVELVLEAESAVFNDVRHDFQGQHNPHGGQFVGNIGSGLTLTFTFNSEVEGDVWLTVYGIAGNPDVANAYSLTVNGVDVQSSGLTTAKCTGSGWSTIGVMSEGIIQIKKGELNTIVYTVTSGAGQVNFDYLTITPADGHEEGGEEGGGDHGGEEGGGSEDENLLTYDGTKPLELQAENAELSSCGAQGNFVGGIGENAKIIFKFKSTVSGTVDLYLYAAGQYDWGGTREDAFEVYVNGTEAPSATVSVGTGGWTNFTKLDAGTAELVEGVNTIEFRAKNTEGQVNVDYLQVGSPVNTYTGEELELDASKLESVQSLGDYQSGNNIVGNIGVGCVITFRVVAKAQSQVKVEVYTDNWNGGDDASFDVYLGDGEDATLIGTCTMSRTGVLDFVWVNAGTATLQEGENIIQIRYNKVGGFNFRSIKLSPIA